MELNIAIIQTDIEWGNIKANIKAADNFVRQLHGCDLAVFPEMFTTGFMATGNPIGEDANSGHGVTWMRDTASARGMAIAGTVIVNDAGKLYNRFIFAHPDDRIDMYDKRHLFSYSGEDKLYIHGDKRVVINYKGFRILPQICYDLRFPVWSRNRNDYDLAIYAASWPQSRVNVWDTLLKARAIENQCYVVGVNRIGDDPSAHYNGHSASVDFYGNTTTTLPDDKAGIINVVLNKGKLDEYRNKFRAWADADEFDIR